MSPFISIFLFSLTVTLSIAKAAVPSSSTFKFVNEGEFGPYITEYGADYRMLGVFNAPFELAFYNTTPNAFTLALRMGLARSESLRRWVWEANRGKPVRENATLTFGKDGNLVLADSDGTIAWQTNTANKGVVGFKLLSNGNIVLHDSKGRFIWQSFDYPTDTLLVGQSLNVNTKLTSRASEKENKNGDYTLLLQPKHFSLIKNSPKPVVYQKTELLFQGSLDSIKFNADPDTDDGFACNLLFETVVNSTSTGSRILARPKYNATSSFLRLGIDGNVKIFTYYDKVDWGAWEETFVLFDRGNEESECQLPERCGKLGVCEDSQCVGCPLQNGVVGWSNQCEAKKLSSCSVKDFKYYKVDGVDHYMSKYNKGIRSIKVEECGKKCSGDCKCLGYFYHQEKSMCWIAYDLKTLTKVSNSSHFGFIKVPTQQVIDRRNWTILDEKL